MLRDNLLKFAIPGKDPTHRDSLVHDLLGKAWLKIWTAAIHVTVQQLESLD